MKSKFWLLFKNNFVNTYKLKSNNKKKLILFAFLLIYTYAALFYMFKMLFSTVYNVLNTVNFVGLYFPILLVISSVAMIFLSIFSTKSALFANKDNDLLFSLPVSRKDILLSRLVIIYLYSLLLSSMFMISGSYVYFSNVPVSIFNITTVVLLWIFVPVIPTIISSLFGYLVAKLVSKSKKQNLAEMIYYCLFVIIYALIVGNRNTFLNLISNNTELLVKIVKYAFFSIYLVLKGMMQSNIIYIFLFVIVNIIVLILFLILMNKSYYKIISSLSKSISKSNYKMTSLNTKTVTKALRLKEIKKYFSSAIYVFNTLFGSVLIVLVGIMSLFYSKEDFAKILSFDGLTLFNVIILILFFCMALTNTTCSSISIERNNFWILKMLPLKTKDIFNAKKFVNEIILIPPVIISIILFTISGYITIYDSLFLIPISIIFSIFISNFGLITNLLFPKLDAINDQVIVKQSAAAFCAIFGGIAIFIIILLLSIGLKINHYYILLIILFVVSLLYLISHIILNKWGEKKYKEIN